MLVLFYNKEKTILSFENTSEVNRIPHIGETVIVEEVWYRVVNIITEYKKLTHNSYSTVSVWLENYKNIKQ